MELFDQKRLNVVYLHTKHLNDQKVDLILDVEELRNLSVLYGFLFVLVIVLIQSMEMILLE
jgi:hypothetical protein